MQQNQHPARVAFVQGGLFFHLKHKSTVFLLCLKLFVFRKAFYIFMPIGPRAHKDLSSTTFLVNKHIAII